MLDGPVDGEGLGSAARWRGTGSTSHSPGPDSAASSSVAPSGDASASDSGASSACGPHAALSRRAGPTGDSVRPDSPYSAEGAGAAEHGRARRQDSESGVFSDASADDKGHGDRPGPSFCWILRLWRAGYSIRDMATAARDAAHGAIRSRLKVYFLASLSIPVDFGWAVGEALVVPELLRMGVAISTCALLWVVPPVLGVMLQPAVSYASDTMGHRKGFIFGLACMAALGLVTIISSSSIFLIFAGFGVVDLSHDLLSTLTRAYVNEVASSDMKEDVNAAYSFMSGIGRLAALVIASLPVEQLFGTQSRMHAVFTLSAFLTILVCGVVVWFGPADRPPHKRGQRKRRRRRAKHGGRRSSRAKHSGNLSPGPTDEWGERIRVRHDDSPAALLDSAAAAAATTTTVDAPTFAAGHGRRDDGGGGGDGGEGEEDEEAGESSRLLAADSSGEEGEERAGASSDSESDSDAGATSGSAVSEDEARPAAAPASAADRGGYTEARARGASVGGDPVLVEMHPLGKAATGASSAGLGPGAGEEWHSPSPRAPRGMDAVCATSPRRLVSRFVRALGTVRELAASGELSRRVLGVYGDLHRVPPGAWALVIMQFTAWLLLMLHSFYWTAWVGNCVGTALPAAAGGGEGVASLFSEAEGEAEEWGTTTLAVSALLGILLAAVLHRVNAALGTKRVYWASLVALSLASIAARLPIGRTWTGSLLLASVGGMADSVYFDNPYVLLEDMLPPGMHAQYVSLLTNSMTAAQLLVSVMGWLTTTSVCSVTDLFAGGGLLTLVIQIATISYDAKHRLIDSP